MDKYLEILSQCSVFRDITKEDMKNLIENINCKVKNYFKGEVVAAEGDECTSIGIIIEGAVEAQKIYASGKVMTIDKLNVGNVFGEAIIFSNARMYPATVMAAQNSTVLFISKKDIIKLCSSDDKVLSNFMSLLSNKILMLNRKIKNMSYKTLRQKIAGFIFDEYKRGTSNIIDLPYSRREMAEHLGVPRPSISRELIKMKEEGVLDFYKNSIKILNIALLEDIFLE